MECVNCYFVGNNDYFEANFAVVYVLLLVLLFIAAVMALIYLILDDSRDSRNLVCWAFLLAAIANFLFLLWVIIYIACIYDRSEVMVTSPEDNANLYGPKKGSKYQPQNKWIYITTHIVGPLLAGLTFLFMYLATRPWVEMKPADGES